MWTGHRTRAMGIPRGPRSGGGRRGGAVLMAPARVVAAPAEGAPAALPRAVTETLPNHVDARSAAEHTRENGKTVKMVIERPAFINLD